jgi:anti-sigma regulatory factor (Ser/Thr protein kinase)
MDHRMIAVGRWFVEADAIPVLDEASVALVRERVRQQAARVGLPDSPAAALVNVASELAHNQRVHARGGFVVVRDAVRGPDRGLEVMAADDGDGIVDVAQALEGRGRRDVAGPSASLGIGLAAVLELADEVDFDVRLGEGTCVWARKFAHTDVRRRRVGIYGRAFRGESTSGDDAAFVRTADALHVGLADGLGHGEGAREASERARHILVAHPELDPERLLARCDQALARTRGAVMAVARIEESGGEVAIASVGNVSAHLVGPTGSKHFGGSSFFLGAPGGVKRLATERGSVQAGQALVLFSDGLSSRADLAGDAMLLRQEPIVIAQRAVEQFGRHNDDATVLVVA